MTAPAALPRPITGEIGRDGHLLRADEALAMLHARAGGEPDGIIACPALFSLSQLVTKLQMRLARAVIVSDGAENVELWTEAEPDGDKVRINILSWRQLPAREATDDTRTARNTDETGDIQLYFDPALRLVGTYGPVAGLISGDAFGANAGAVIAHILGRLAPRYVAKIQQLNILEEQIVTLGDGRNMLFSGYPAFSLQGEPSGYICQLRQINEAQAVVTQAEPMSRSGAIFGKNLAPVLRQPLSRIIANAETIGGELLGPIRENYATYARDIANAARHLAALVDDLGDLEAVERADFSTAKDNIELGDVARRVAGLLALKAADHSISIIVPDEKTQVPATAEFRRVLQIMLNLVTNAIRYAPDGSVVLVQTTQGADFAEITVIDQGAGIAADDRERIFEKFERLGRTGDGGSGLGLYISRRLARAMGGDLTVANAQGGGAAFTLRLPR